MTPAQIKALIIGLVILALCAGSAKVGYDLAAGKAAREELLIEKAGDAAAARAAAAIADIKVVHKTIQNQLEREIIHVPDLNTCHAGPSVERLLNDALEGRAPAAGGGVVPGPNPAG